MHYYKITYELDNGINKKTETIKIMAHDVLQAINSLNENSLLISNLSIVEIDKKEFEKDIITTMRVEFDVDIKKEFVDEFSRIIDHHIEYMIDLSEFPEIKGIGNAKLYCKESENESTINIDDYYIISQEKVGFENGTEKHFIEYLDKNNKWTKVKENALKHVSLSSATTNYTKHFSYKNKDLVLFSDKRIGKFPEITIIHVIKVNDKIVKENSIDLFKLKED